jgi:cephalosporin hydroxylase
VIELGVKDGGSSLWFRDRLADLQRPPLGSRGQRRLRLIAVDIDTNPGLPADVAFVRGDIRDPELPGRVARLLPSGARPFIVEDTAHTYETTTAALKGFSPLVPKGGYLVIEDGVVDVESLRIDAG